MADVNEKYKENVTGKYYVDETCIGCLICVEIAPGNIKENRDENLLTAHTYFYHQPLTHAEIEACEEALDICPVDAIGHDGTE